MLKWLWTEAWTDANFCNARIRRKPSIARSRLRNGWWEFSAQLFAQRPVSWRLAIGGPEVPEGRHDLISRIMSLQRFLQEFQCGFLVTGLGHEALMHFAFVIDDPPKVVPLAVDFDENLIQMPAPMA